ncbi:hypothetical protein APUTEX25_001621 [Auxenochlorella protothecoides]|uniref:Methyltransferase domain-containing protein n=1 Tax=Auxenochlorella protothecoides TaxID=3075 RepID=A0A3M7KNV5_AUXPR|nr:hypothetical protein APUTEX25_001621 [Auxenochlorella protothecoides]|eukprot:RMZ52231.1 hypothetical protein APUTEX25_001621 [Auxenochlorella protothecoides]
MLQRSWSEAAAAYQEHMVPRFVPWTLATLDAFGSTRIPEGLVVVPACGPGQELPLLADLLPNHDILGVDLAEGMVAIARRVIQHQNLRRVTAMAGDAKSLTQLSGSRPITGIYSCFGLQIIPGPAETLRSWAASLAPGGTLAVTYWPEIAEQEGPWRTLISLTPPADRPADWEVGIPGEALKEPGVELVADKGLDFSMEWPSAGAFFDILSTAGPWRALAILRGPAFMEELRRKFLATCPEADAEPLVHTLTARMIVLRKAGQILSAWLIRDSIFESWPKL